jgi:hypothetical protein
MLERGGSGSGVGLELEMRLMQAGQVRCVCQTSVRVGEKAAGMAWPGIRVLRVLLTPRGVACGLACRSL